jgi:hypothetical protein
MGTDADEWLSVQQRLVTSLTEGIREASIALSSRSAVQAGSQMRCKGPIAAGTRLRVLCVPC